MLRTAQNNQELFSDYVPTNHFKIALLPHLKKFINIQYGFNVKKPIVIDEYHPMGKSIMLALRDNRLTAEYNDQYRDRLTSEITIVLTKRMMELSPKIIKLLKINIDIDLLFKQHLLTWVTAQNSIGIPTYTACRFFLEYFRIDDSEYSLDAAYKYCQRTEKAA